jgi:hypothetical protein
MLDFGDIKETLYTCPSRWSRVAATFLVREMPKSLLKRGIS